MTLALAKSADPLVDGFGGVVEATERAHVGVSGLEADILCGIGPVDADERGDWLVR